MLTFCDLCLDSFNASMAIVEVFYHFFRPLNIYIGNFRVNSQHDWRIEEEELWSQTKRPE